MFHGSVMLQAKGAFEEKKRKVIALLT